MVSNVGLNFLVKRGGEKVVSYLCYAKLPKTVINFESVKYNPNYDTFKFDRINKLLGHVDKKISLLSSSPNSLIEEQGINFILKRLQKGDSIILGDGNHSKSIQHDYIAKNLDKLYGKGVRKIYLEFLRIGDESNALEKFYKTGNISDLAKLTIDSLPNPESLLALIKLCKAKGIKCYAVDTVGSIASRNEAWADMIKKTNNDEQYLLIAGTGHLSGSVHMRFEKLLNKIDKGIDKLLGDNVSVLELDNLATYSWDKPVELCCENISENYACIKYLPKSVNIS